MSKKILIVEDDSTLLKLQSILLFNKGYEVEATMSGNTAVLLVSEKSPDLVLLDVRLPGINGFEVCKQIRNNPHTKDIPIVFLSAKNADEDIRYGKEVGGNEYITKPYNSKNVMSTIHKLLDGYVHENQGQGHQE